MHVNTHTALHNRRQQLSEFNHAVTRATLLIARQDPFPKPLTNTEKTRTLLIHLKPPALHTTPQDNPHYINPISLFVIAISTTISPTQFSVITTPAIATHFTPELSKSHPFHSPLPPFLTSLPHQQQ